MATALSRDELIWNNSGCSAVHKGMSEQGLIIAAGASFGLGLFASLTPPIYQRVSADIASVTATQESGRWRRGVLLATFVAGMATLAAPLGLIVGLGGNAMGWTLWSSASICVIALLCTVLAGSMFGAYELTLPPGLATKLSAVGGGGGLQGAFAKGLVMGVVGAPTTVPFAFALATLVAKSGNPWLGAAMLGAFALGLGAVSFVAGTFGVTLPKGGAWMMGVTWISGVGLAYLAFAHARDRFVPIRSLVGNPRYEFGIIAGSVFLVGIALGAVHVLAERRGSRIVRLSKPLRLASILPAVIGGALFISWAPYPHGNAPPITFFADEAYGRALADAENKPVVIVFNADWCCREVEHDMFPDPRVRTAAQRFVAIHVDASNNDQSDDPELMRLQRKYEIIGVPTIIMLDSAGNEISRINSMVSPVVLAAQLDAVPD